MSSQSGDVLLALESIGTPVEPTAVVGVGVLQQWSEPETTSYAPGSDAVLSSPGSEGEHPPAPLDRFAAPDPVPVMMTPENATAANAREGDGETDGSKAPDEPTRGKENDEMAEPVLTPDEARDMESIRIATATANATAANLTSQAFLKEYGEANRSPLSPGIPTAGEKIGGDGNLPEAMEFNESVEGSLLREPAGEVSFDEDEPAPAPPAPAAGVMPGVRAAGDGIWFICAPVTITNPGDVALGDYQVRVEVPYQLGMRGDFRDIRFTGDITGPLLPHWCDEYSSLDSAVFWVRVPSIPADGMTIYLHYGNWDAESASNGTATFLFYDDFEDYIVEDFPNGWTKEGNFDVRVVNNGGSKVLRIDDNTYERGYLYRDDQNWLDVAVRERFKFDPSSTFLETIQAGVIARFLDGGDYISGPVKKEPPWQDSAWVEGYVGGQHWFDEPLEVPGGATGWHTEELCLFGQRADLYIDDTLLKSVHLPADTPSLGKTGFFVQKWSGYRDEHIIRNYSPVYEGGRYHSPGTITSDVLDTTTNDSKWDSLAWTADIPAETNISFEVWASNSSNAIPDWTPVGNTSPVSTNLPQGRYLQWRANLSTTEETVTPVLQEVRVWYTPGGY